MLPNPHHRHLLLTTVVGVGLLAYATGSIEAVYGFDVAMVLALVGGFPIYYGAVRWLLRGKITADLAVTLAAIAALAIQEYLVAAEVIFIMLIGEALENFAVGRTRSGIARLLKLTPDEARVRHPGHDHDHVLPVDRIQPDDIVIVRPGDRIPVDGRVLSGSSAVDQSPITGESLPADKAPGDEVYAGTISLNGAMEIAIERLGEDTTLQRIIHLVEEAEAAKAPTQRLADRYATYFVPVVLAAAVVTFLVTGEVVRAVSVLVVACPCALVLATPAAIAAGIGALVGRGVLVKGGTVLEKLGRLKSVVFDKTGTLTLARLRISQIAPVEGMDDEELLRTAAAVEQHSEHPLAQLIVERVREARIAPQDVTGFTARPGLGAEARLADETIRVGNGQLMREAGVAIPKDYARRLEELRQAGNTLVLVARDHRLIGAVAVQDTVRPEAEPAVKRLREQGIRRIAMLTGDHQAAAQAVAERLGIKEVQSELLPADKVEAVRQMQREAAPVAMVGDGINDAPSLVAADVGVAMAQIGTDVAIESADLVLVGDDLRKLSIAVSCGRATMRVIWQNILGFAVAFNVVAVIAASLGWISPVAAAVLHQVSSLIVVLNSLRLLVDWQRWRARVRDSGYLVRRHWRWAALAASAAAIAVYLLSGLFVVSPGEVAVEQRFGRLVGEPRGPGLHYRLPVPLGTHEIIRPRELRRVEMGFRTIEGEWDEPAAYEWNVQHRGGRIQYEANEAKVLTGDENYVDVKWIVHYRVAEPLTALFCVGRRRADGGNKWDELVRGVAESCLRAEMAGQSMNTVLADRRHDVEAALHARIAAALDRYETGLAVESVCLGDVHPPVDVVPAFREVAGALEEKESKINEAKAYQVEAWAMARAELEARPLLAEASAHDRRERATGEADRFAETARASQENRELTRLRLYLQATEELLAGRRKIILDRAAHGSRRRLFLGPKPLWSPPTVFPGEEPADFNAGDFPQP
jgi:Cu+-exporting ATPase